MNIKGSESEKLRIAIFADNFLPQINGVVTANLNLIKGLAQKGHKVIVFAPEYKDSGKEFKFPNVKVIRISSIPFFFYPDIRIANPISVIISKIIKKEKIQVLHFSSPLGLGFQAVNIGKKLKLPVVGTFHTFFTDSQYLKRSNLDFTITKKLLTTYSNWFYNSCDLVTTPSEYTMCDIKDNGVTTRINVISNGIDFSEFDNSLSKEFKDKYNPKGKTLLFVGRIAHEKNIIYLLECFKLIAKVRSDVKLLIIGDGPEFSLVNGKIEKLGLHDRVILLGKMEHSILIKSGVFKACDLFVTASVTENQPMTILEAQANDLVCVGVDAKGMSDIIKSGINGILVNVGDKKGFAESVIKVLSDNKLRSMLKKGALLEVKRHNLANVIEEWERSYRELVLRT